MGETLQIVQRLVAGGLRMRVEVVVDVAGYLGSGPGGAGGLFVLALGPQLDVDAVGGHHGVGVGRGQACGRVGRQVFGGLVVVGGTHDDGGGIDHVAAVEVGV